MIYGHNKTIHRTGHVDVEVDSNGNVVSVWYRCMMLPFQQHNVEEQRAESMRNCNNLPAIMAIEVEDRNGKED